jgi:4-hydroxy-tetrahydrodipicolinate synthase
VTSNVAPALVSRLCEAAARGDFGDARALHHKLSPWTTAAFIESNPIPSKAALHMMGMMENVVRVPLVPLADKYHTTIRQSLAAIGALSA